MPETRNFGNRKDLITALIKTIWTQLSKHIEAKGQAGLVVAGGSTPKLIYPKLSHEILDWSKVFVTLTDERLVKPTHDASNEKMVRSTLLQNRASDATFVRLISNQRSPKEAEEEVERGLELMPTPYAVTLVGMGNDGHFASLFPEDPSLQQGLDLDSGKRAKAVILKNPPAEAPYPRMTMTLPEILNSDLVAVLLMGDAKQDTLKDAFASDDATEMPIRALFRQQRTNVEIFWAP